MPSARQKRIQRRFGFLTAFRNAAAKAGDHVLDEAISLARRGDLDNALLTLKHGARPPAKRRSKAEQRRAFNNLFKLPPRR